MIKFYQVVNNKEDRVSSSPFVLATELFLKHKNLDFEPIPLTYVEIGPTINKITNDEWSKVPTLIFPNGDIVFDSPKIATYLDKHYPTPNQIVKNPNLDALIEEYDKKASLSLIKLTSTPLYKSLDNENQEYFRGGMEMMFGVPLEHLADEKQESIKSFYNGAECLLETLAQSNFLDGNEPGIHDYNIMGRIQSFRTICPSVYKELVNNHSGEVFKDWLLRMDNLFDGYLKSRKTL